MRNTNFGELLTTKYTQLLERSQVVAAIALFLKKSFLLSPLSITHLCGFSLYLFIFFASRPPLGGIDDGAGGFAQDPPVRVLFGNDGEQRLYGLEKLWSLGACKGPQRCRQFFKLRSFERKIFVAMLRKNAIL